MDEADKLLPPLRAFILPGGTAAAVALHLARTVTRRAERSLVALSGEARVRSEVLVYVNRLSDLLFVLARSVNQCAGHADVQWMPDKR
jgi:cob(I)alamin adenosyltransferase